MAENEQKTLKKFRVRFKKDPSSSDIIEPGEIFIEERSLGTRLLKSNFSDEKSIPYEKIAGPTVNTTNDNLNNYFSKNVLNNGLTVVDVNGQLLSTGKDTTKTTEINLDTYIQGGIYLFNMLNFVLKETFNGGSLKNTSLPTQRGYLIVIEGLSSGDIRQIFIDNYGIQHNDTPERMFIRGKASGNWSNWKEILTTVHKSDLIKEAREEIKSGWYQIKEDSWSYNNDEKAWEHSGKIKYSTPYKEDCTPIVVASLATNYPLKANVSIDIVEASNRKNEFKFLVQSTITDSNTKPGNMSFYWISTISNYQKDESKK